MTTSFMGMFIATLAHPATPSSTLAEAARSALADAGLRTTARPAIDAAAVVAVEAPSAGAVGAALAPLRARADVVVVPEGWMPALFVADMDSTMIDCECIDELADFAGRKAEVAALTERAMRGELDFAQSLRARVATLAGLEQSAIERTLAERVRPNPGAETLVRTLGALRVRTVLVTGGFTHFAEPVAARLGFDRVVANRLEIADGRLTGRVLGDIVDAHGKLAALTEAARALGHPARSIAIGDGANDARMLAGADLSVGYRPKPALRAVADAVLDHGELTMLLWALGIPSERWVAAHVNGPGLP